VLGPVQGRSDKRVRLCAKKASKFANHTNNSRWETLAQRKKTVHICALFKTYTGEWAWKCIRGRLKGPCNLSKDDHERNIWNKIQGTDVSKYSFVNRIIKMWSQLPAELLETFPFNSNIFRKRVRKVIISEEKESVCFSMSLSKYSN
jgi:hypothetical protein